jgi:hypothetical protein
MADDGPDVSAVTALHFDEASLAADLAVWCGGAVAASATGELVVLVPGRHGARPARLGDWIVLNPDGTHRVVSAADFAASFEPL